VLHDNGYINGCIGKLIHLAPEHKYKWSMGLSFVDLKSGRDPKMYHDRCSEFFEMADHEGKPFFLMANSHDPHRPFHASDDEIPMRQQWGPHMKTPSREYSPGEVDALGFLPDLPETRKQTAQYHSSCRRCDDTVGEILRALRETGHDDDTLVMFLSDNGMSFPFAKCCCYLHSTKTPWIVRWPGHVKPGAVDDRHFISGIDFMATILEATGCQQVDGMDGQSFLPLLEGDSQDGWDEVYTVFYKVFPVEGGARPEQTQYFPMRCVQNRRFGYIYNKWSDGEMEFTPIARPRILAEMREAGKTDPAVQQRLEMFLHRVPEELYDFEKDPHALHNLIDDARYRDEVNRMRVKMAAWMKEKRDRLLADFTSFIEASERKGV
jgi:N-sulfoglucosamine sulfohydrolase